MTTKRDVTAGQRRRQERERRRITTDQTSPAQALEDTDRSTDDPQLAYTLAPISAVAAV